MSDDSETTPDDGGQGVWSQRGFVIGAVVVALLAIGVVFVVVTTGGSDDENTAQDPAPPAASPQDTADETEPPNEPADDQGADSVCGLDTTNDEVPTEAPEAEWELVGSIAAPVQSPHGPGEQTSDGAMFCFEHSPSGALVAATSILAQAQDPELVVDTVDRSITGEPSGVEITRAEAEEAAASRTSQTSMEIEGFNFVNYTPQTATIELVARDNQSAMALVMTMEWTEGDWKAVVDAEGQAFSSPRRDERIDAITWSAS